MKNAYVNEERVDYPSPSNATTRLIAHSSPSFAAFLARFFLALRFFFPLPFLPNFASSVGFRGVGVDSPFFHTREFHSKLSTSSCSHRNYRTSGMYLPSAMFMSTVSTSMA